MAGQVLLVDDEEVFAQLTTEQLSSRGFSLAVVNDSRQACAAAKEKRPDAIILDMMMPEMDGAEILKKLKEDAATAAIPVLVCSAHLTERAMIQTLLKAGAADFIHKPFAPDELAGKLRKLIDSKR